MSVPSLPDLPAPLAPCVPPTVAHPPWTRWADAWVGFWERRRARRQGPSSRAWAEALAYYRGLYQERSPCPSAFRRLLRRGGVPAWRNPYPDDQALHFAYHPDGLLIADLEMVLEDLLATPAAPQGPLPGVSAEAWMTLAQAQEDSEAEKASRQREWARLAGVCWGMALLEKGSLTAVTSAVHPDNLVWATLHAWRIAPWAQWGIDPDSVLDAAQARGIVTPELAQISRRLLTPGLPSAAAKSAPKP